MNKLNTLSILNIFTASRGKKAVQSGKTWYYDGNLRLNAVSPF